MLIILFLLQILYTCVDCILPGLLLIEDKLFIIHSGGFIVHISAVDGQLIRYYHIPNVGYLCHQSSISSSLNTILDTDILLLADRDRGEVFTYRLSTNTKHVHLTGLKVPRSVSHCLYNNQTYYIVCEDGAHLVKIYDQKWVLLRTIGNGELGSPVVYDNPVDTLGSTTSAVVTTEGHILVADWTNRRVSEFDFKGRFIRHLLTHSDGISKPWSMSFQHPYLWVTYPLLRFKLYED